MTTREPVGNMRITLSVCDVFILDLPCCESKYQIKIGVYEGQTVIELLQLYEQAHFDVVMSRVDQEMLTLYTTP